MKKKLIFILTFAFLAFYAWYIEPQWIEINQFDLKVPIKQKVKIMQISDLHTTGLGRVEKKLLRLLKQSDLMPSS